MLLGTCHCELLHSAVAPLIEKEIIVGVIARSGFCDEALSPVLTKYRAIPSSLAGDCFGKKTPRNDTAVSCFLVAERSNLQAR